jgi:hypothetical protein
VIDQLAKLAELMLKVTERRSAVIETKHKRELLLDLLTTYFILRGVLEVGQRLIEHAGDDAVETVTRMPPPDASKWLVECKYLILAQRAKLHRLSKLLGCDGLPIVDILDSDLRTELHRLIGSKESGLYSLGAGLEIHLLFGGLPSQEDLSIYGRAVANLRSDAHILQALISSDGEPIAIVRVQTDLKAIESATERLRAVISDICSKSEMLELSAEAERRAKSADAVEPRYSRI